MVHYLSEAAPRLRDCQTYRTALGKESFNLGTTVSKKETGGEDGLKRLQIHLKKILAALSAAAAGIYICTYFFLWTYVWDSHSFQGF